MKTIDWFKESVLFSDKHRKTWFYVGVVLFIGCLILTVYLSF